MFPNLAGQPAVYLESQLKAFRVQSRADPHAQAFTWGMAAQLTDASIAKIAMYYAAQPPAPGKPAGREETAAGRKIYEEGIPAQHERQLAAFMSNARANEAMHRNSKNLTALQIRQIAAFVSAQ